MHIEKDKLCFANRNDMLSLLPSGARCAEVGVLWGDFSQVMFDTLKPSLLTLIDCWKHQDNEYQYDKSNHSQETQDAHYNTVVSRFAGCKAVDIIRDFSLDAARRIPDGSLDAAYLDANHTYPSVLSDLEAYSAKVKPGGYLMGHDYCKCDEQHFGVVEAVDEFCSKNGWEIVAVTNEEWPSYALKKVIGIPKIIHTAWYGQKEAPDIFKKCIDSIHSLCKDYDFKMWSKDSSPNSKHFAQAWELKNYANCSNYIRHYALHQDGGVYIDIDVEILKPFGDLLNERAFLGWQRKDQIADSVNTAVIGSEQGNWFMKRMLDIIEGYDPNAFQIATAVTLQTNELMRLGLTELNKDARINGVRVLPLEYFYPFSWTEEYSQERITENTRTIHWWEKSWSQ